MFEIMIQARQLIIPLIIDRRYMTFQDDSWPFSFRSKSWPDLLDLIRGPRTTENGVSLMKMFKCGGLQIPATRLGVVSMQVHIMFWEVYLWNICYKSINFKYQNNIKGKNQVQVLVQI